MRTKKKTQVLVVGAGPVGLTAAICLQQRGIDFEILDKASGPSEHCKACLLSPETLEFFKDLGLLEAVMDRALSLKAMQLFDGRDCLAVFEFSTLPSSIPYVASIPQSELEDILLATLKSGKKKVLWNHRVAQVNRSSNGITITVDKLGQHMMGYAVMHEEMLVDKTFGIEAKVVLAADGFHSLIRRLNKVAYEPVGNPMGSLVFESQDSFSGDAILSLGFSDAGASSYFPLPNHRSRYGFTVDQLTEVSADRDKGHNVYDEDLANFEGLADEDLRLLLEARMPYLAHKKPDIVWRAAVPFGIRLADRVWDRGIFLMGDAARSGFPLSAKSINHGIPEAGKVVEALDTYLEDDDANEIEKVATSMRMEWEDLASLEYFSARPDLKGPLKHVDLNLVLQALPLTGDDLAFAAHKLDKCFARSSKILKGRS